MSACPASANPPTPNLRPCINHWAWKTESQRWVGGCGGGGRVETRPTLLLFHLRLFGQEGRESERECEREREREKNKENENARDQKAEKK